MITEYGTCEAVKKYSFRVDEDGGIILDFDGAMDDPGSKLHRLATEYQAMHPEVDYRSALRVVMGQRPDLTRDHAARLAVASPRIYTRGATPANDPAAEADERTRQLMDAEPCLSYSRAAQRVLAEHPTLAARWAGFASNGRDHGG